MHNMTTNTAGTRRTGDGTINGGNVAITAVNGVAGTGPVGVASKTPTNTVKAGGDEPQWEGRWE